MIPFLTDVSYENIYSNTYINYRFFFFDYTGFLFHPGTPLEIFFTTCELILVFLNVVKIDHKNNAKLYALTNKLMKNCLEEAGIK